MADHDGRPHALQMIFAFLLGLMVVALVGVGVHKFYPAPSQSDSKLQKLDSEQKALETSQRLVGTMSSPHKAFYEKVSADLAAEKKAIQTGRNSWIRNTIIILIAFAALVLGLSIVLSERSRGIANGLLLGGLFTMWYCAAWSFTRSGPSTRWAVVAVAVLVTLAVGYLKFVRMRKPEASGAT